MEYAEISIYNPTENSRETDNSKTTRISLIDKCVSVHRWIGCLFTTSNSTLCGENHLNTKVRGYYFKYFVG